MKVTGIIAEYNPMHSGHKYQIDFAKRDSDAVVVIMSGSFVQRGAVAVFDKWTRAEAALLCGADLVLELPVPFAVHTAERFAFGAVSTLSRLGIVDRLCFGSESGDLTALEQAADILSHEPPAVSAEIQRLLQAGLGYPAARQQAFADLIPETLLKEPNNILALEYLCAIKKQNSNLKPLTLRREGGYHSTRTDGAFASAAAIRNAMQEDADFLHLVPPAVRKLYQNAVRYDTTKLDSVIAYFLRTATPETLRAVPDVAEGLENRLIAAAKQYSTMDEIVAHTVTKRYTAARIRRILLAALLGLMPALSAEPPAYARILGMNDTGKALLAEARKTAALQLVTKTADYTDAVFQKDILATDLAALCADKPKARIAGKDFTTSPVIF